MKIFLPVITASRLARSLKESLLVAMLLGVASVFVGLVASYEFDLAPGGAIVLVAAGSFVAVGAATEATRFLHRS